MWRLWHRLFGWHFVAFSYGYSHHVRRVRLDGNGNAYVRICDEHLYLSDKTERWQPLTFRSAPEPQQGDNVVCHAWRPLNFH